MLITLTILYFSMLLLYFGSLNGKIAEAIMKSIAVIGLIFWLGGHRWFN